MIAVFDSKGLRYVRAFGVKEPGGEPVREDTVYDLASLTKVIVTAPVFMRLVEEGLVSPLTPLKLVLEELRNDWKGDLTFFRLLTHTSGLPAYVDLTGSDDPKRTVLELPREYETGSRVVYSCMGYILTGFAIERIAGKGLDEVAKDLVFEPLGMESTFYNPPDGIDIAPTTRLGKVHDPNAFTLGGVSGNAGLFSNAFDIVKFMVSYVNGKILSPSSVDYSTRNHTPGLNEKRGMGWKIAEGVTFPELLSARAFGHTGYTGTQVWYDPDRDCGLVILTNRVNLKDDEESKRLNNEFRRRVGNFVLSRC